VCPLVRRNSDISGRCTASRAKCLGRSNRFPSSVAFSSLILHQTYSAHTKWRMTPGEGTSRRDYLKLMAAQEVWPRQHRPAGPRKPRRKRASWGSDLASWRERLYPEKTKLESASKACPRAKFHRTLHDSQKWSTVCNRSRTEVHPSVERSLLPRSVAGV
jgi:hypothetical protein